MIELENQREQSQKEILAVSARLGILADEVLLQKRMTIFQSILLLLCLGFVIFSRSSIGNYMEFPVVPSLKSRSSARRMRLPLESPLTSPSYTRPSSSREEDRLFSSDSPSPERRSNGHVESAPRLTIEVSPPRSPSSAELSDSEGRTDLSTSPEQSDVRQRRPHGQGPGPGPGQQYSAGATSKPSRDEGRLYSWRVDGGSELLRPGDPFVGPSSGGVRSSASPRQMHEASTATADHHNEVTAHVAGNDAKDDLSDESPLGWIVK